MKREQASIVRIIAALLLVLPVACAPHASQVFSAPSWRAQSNAPIQSPSLVPILHVLPLFNYPGGADGVDPVPVLSGDPTVALFGVTTNGGNFGNGVVYVLHPPQNGGQFYTETVLHHFRGSDGANPNAGLFPVDFEPGQNPAQLLYGTTQFGGAYNQGTAYEVSQDGTTFQTLYSFRGGSDGAVPSSLLHMDSAGNLFGTTLQGGQAGCGTTSCCPNRCGTVFELSPNGNGTYSERVIYRFKWGTDGWYPYASITPFHDNTTGGSLYGTTLFGGNSDCPGNPTLVPGGQGCGTIYRLDPSSNGYTETVVHRFTEGMDGNRPLSHMIHIGGTFYSTTFGGGISACVNGCGTVFKFATAANKYDVIHRFEGGAQGGQPRGGMSLYKGNLFGTTVSGGSALHCGFTIGCGVMYEITPHGDYTALCIVERPSDGRNPQTTVFHGPLTDKLFGSSLAGGLHGFGRVFEFEGLSTPPPGGKLFC